MCCWQGAAGCLAPAAAHPWSGYSVELPGAAEAGAIRPAKAAAAAAVLLVVGALLPRLLLLMLGKGGLQAGRQARRRCRGATEGLWGHGARRRRRRALALHAGRPAAAPHLQLRLAAVGLGQVARLQRLQPVDVQPHPGMVPAGGGQDEGSGDSVSSSSSRRA